MAYYKKKYVKVEAWQVGTEPIPNWIDQITPTQPISPRRPAYYILMDEISYLFVEQDDWIVIDNGKFLRFDPDEFSNLFVEWNDDEDMSF